MPARSGDPASLPGAPSGGARPRQGSELPVDLLGLPPQAPQHIGIRSEPDCKPRPFRRKPTVNAGLCATNEQETQGARQPIPCYLSRAVELDREKGAEPRRQTCARRHVAVVTAPRLGVLRPITRWPLSEESAKRYQAWRKTVTR